MRSPDASTDFVDRPASADSDHSLQFVSAIFSYVIDKTGKLANIKGTLAL